MRFVPLKDAIVVEIAKEKESKKAIIIVPDEHKKTDVIVKAVGPLVTNLIVGDKVLLNYTTGLFKLDDEFGKDLYITKEDNVVGIIKEN